MILMALYSYKSTHSRTLAFCAGDKFLEIGTSRDPNWVHVINECGIIGYVPKNYISTYQGEYDCLDFIDGCIEGIHLRAGENEGTYGKGEQEALNKLAHIRCQLNKPQSSKFGTSTKRPAPLPPKQDDSCTNSITHTSGPENSTINSTENVVVKDSNQCSKSLISSQSFSSNLDVDINVRSLSSTLPKGIMRLMVEAVRKDTDISYRDSQQAVKVVLEQLASAVPALNPVTRAILNDTIASPNSNTGEAKWWQQSTDASRAVRLLDELRECKDDEQQRSWALHEDLQTIKQHLQQLLDLMSNGDLVAVKGVLAMEDFRPLLTLVQYYQMETRLPLRKLLLQIFGAVCQMDSSNVSYLSSSILPVELSRELMSSDTSVETLEYCALVLGMVMSSCDSLPYTHFSIMNREFVVMLLEGVEKYSSAPETEELSSLYLTLVLAFNLQDWNVQGGINELPTSSVNGTTSTNETSNIVLQELGASSSSSNYFLEKLLLLFNREDDPLNMFERENTTHSVLQMMQDLYSSPTTANLLYTNDERVLCDIVLRQLHDLPPDDQKRLSYLRLSAGIVRRGKWLEHEHRIEELKGCLKSILAEDTDTITTAEGDAEVRNLLRELIADTQQLRD